MASQFLMARQPIMDRQGKVHAYELLYRKAGAVAAGPLDEGDEHQSILNALVEIGLARLVGDKPAFFNISPAMLGSIATDLLPVDRVVLELLEDTVLDDATAARIGELKGQGYQLAYDDFTFQAHQIPFANHVGLIKIDVMDTPWPIVQHGVPMLAAKGIRLLAEKVEDQEMFRKCQDVGFDLFQGYFFSRPETMASKGLDSNRQSALKLLATINRKDVTAGQLEEAIARDAALAARLLKLVNSAGFGAHARIDSIRVAIQMLGLTRLQAFATVLAAAGASGKDNRALCDLGLIRARMCERVACQLGHGDTHRHFTIGLLSVLDALMNLPMGEVVQALELPDEVSGALLQPEQYDELRVVTALEQGGWSQLKGYDVDADALNEAYAAAIADTAALG